MNDSISERTELKKLILQTIKKSDLIELANSFNKDSKGTIDNLITGLLNIPIDDIRKFIKRKYQEKIEARREITPDDILKHELMKVNEVKWGVVQGELDGKIQREYVRKFYKYDELLLNAKNYLYNDVEGYVISTWYNHWTTVLIEDHISSHPRVIPTLKNKGGIDTFFDNHPFDLKITYLPKKYVSSGMPNDEKELIKWLYENQGAQRFGADNRLFIVLLNKNKPEDSWELKRDFDFIFRRIDEFFDNSIITEDDKIKFNFHGKEYRTISKMLIISK